MRYIIDRIEGELAVCEADDLKQVEFKTSQLPKGAKEGSTLVLNDAGSLILIEDDERAQRIADKMKSVWK